MQTVDLFSQLKSLKAAPIKVVSRFVDVKFSYRYMVKNIEHLTQITRSDHTEALIRSVYDKDNIALCESFYVIALNRANRVIAIMQISQGGMTATICDIRFVMLFLITVGAQNAICSHNHPSGNLKPSAADIDLTKRLSEACRLFDIYLNDHVILSPDEGKWYSFADEGII